MPVAKCLEEQGFKLEVQTADSEDLDVNEKKFLELIKQVKEADLIIVRLHSDTSHFKKWGRFEEAAKLTKGLLFVDSHMEEVAREVRPLFKGSDEEYDLLRRYVELGGDENNRAIILWALRRIGGLDVEVPEPRRQRTEGVYHPDQPRDIELLDYLATLDPSRPTIGILFFQGYWSSKTSSP